MSNEMIISVLLTIIGVLISVVCGLFVASIKGIIKNMGDDIRELKDMFTRHVRNPKIHVNCLGTAERMASNV